MFKKEKEMNVQNTNSIPRITLKLMDILKNRWATAMIESDVSEMLQRALGIVLAIFVYSFIFFSMKTLLKNNVTANSDIVCIAT
jgi:hypothetical protein